MFYSAGYRTPKMPEWAPTPEDSRLDTLLDSVHRLETEIGSIRDDLSALNQFIREVRDETTREE